MIGISASDSFPQMQKACPERSEGNTDVLLSVFFCICGRVLAIFVFGLTACCSTALPTAAPTNAPVAFAPTSTLTTIATATPTAVPTPTAFVTAPASGAAAIVPILMYHNLKDLPVTATESQRTWTVAPEDFEAQMDWLAQRGFHTITMAQLVAHLKQRQPLPAKPLIISFDDGWAEQYTVAFPVLKRHGFIGTFFVYTNPLDRKQYLTWVQLQEMSAAGMDIQAHTLSHPHLRALAPDAAMHEIAESKRILESQLGKRVIALSYPYGEYNDTVVGMVKRAGFESAVTLASGYRQRADELFTLHRIRVSFGETLEDLAKRLP